MRTLIIETHYDDAVIGCFGTILKEHTKKLGNEYFIFTVCYGRSNDLNDNRELIARKLYDQHNFNHSCNLNLPDLSLRLDHTDRISKTIIGIITAFKPDTVFIPEPDLHPDHMIVNRASLVACRPTPNSSIRNVYQYSVPSSSEWDFNMIKENSGFRVVELSEALVSEKLHCITAFNSEIKTGNDLRSGEAHKTLLKMNGYKFGYDYAEVFKVIYSRG